MAQTNIRRSPVVKTSATQRRGDPAAGRATIADRTMVLSEEFLSGVIQRPRQAPASRSRRVSEP